MNKKKNFLKWLGIVLFALVLLTGLSLIFFSYDGIYPRFVPLSWQFEVDNTLAVVPFVPKTTRQILVRSLIQTKELSGYKTDTSFSLKLGQEELAYVNLKGTISDPGSFSSTYLAELSTVRTSGVSANFAESGTNFYFKINDPLVLPGLIIPKAKKIWYKVDLNSLNQSLGVKLRQDSDIVNDINSRLIENWDNLNMVVSKNSQLSQETLNKVATYKITLSLNKKLLNALLSESANFDSPKLTLWVDKNNFQIKRLFFSGNFNSGLDQKEDTLEIDYQISPTTEIGNIPNENKEITNSIDLWTNLNLEDSDNTTDALFSTAQNSPSFGQNFLTMERLIKVFLLLPKSL